MKTAAEKEAAKIERKTAREAAKTAARIEAERNQKPVRAMTLTIEWKKSRTWGANPNLEAEVWFQDGTFQRSPVFKCSGCGYNKTSTVIAQAFNTYLSYKLWAMTPEQVKGGHGSGDKGAAPYGVSCHNAEHRHYAGGIGERCYKHISEYIGGQWETLASGKTFDVFRYTDGKAAK